MLSGRLELQEWNRRTDLAAADKKRRTAPEPPPEEEYPEVELAPIEIDAGPQPPSRPVPREDEESVMGAFEAYLEPSSTPEPARGAEAVALSIEPAPEPQVQPEADAFSRRVIGGYRIESFIAEDDISRAYRALQLSMERLVCLKILSPEMTHDSEAVDRFITAARAGGKLSHPNIVQVYDAGEENGAYFIALELVDGKTLRRYLQERGRHRPLPRPQAVDVAEQVADALGYAHAQSVIHRNVTPENIYITPHNVAKLADLGFSKHLADSGIQRPSRFGERPGDLYFTAPEQLIDPRAATVRSDIYALGSVLFVMLTGHMPFRGESAKEIFERVRDGRHENIQRLQRDVPVELARVVDRAMAHQPEDRYGSASAFQKDLRRVRGRLGL